MITKERLKELIEQGATIYSTGYREEVDLSLPCYIKDGYLIVDEENDVEPTYLLENLTESLEEAEWQAEFGNIERVERLVLPTWEEFRNSSGFDFVSKNKQTIYVMNHFFDNEIYITDQWGYNETFEYTPNGYIEACRKAKELFLKGKEQ